MIIKIRRLQSIACIAGFMLLLAGCGTWNISPEHTYLKALKHFNNTIETYEQHYQLQTSETKAKWKERIDPLIKTANDALDIWRTMIGDTQAEMNYQMVFSQLVQALFSIGVIEVEEK